MKTKCRNFRTKMLFTPNVITQVSVLQSHGKLALQWSAILQEYDRKLVPLKQKKLPPKNVTLLLN